MTEAPALLADAGTLRAVLDASPAPMVVVGLTGAVLLRNLAHKRLLAQNGITPVGHNEPGWGVLEDVVGEPDRVQAFAARLAAEPDQEHEEEFFLPALARRLSVRSAPVRARLGGETLAHVIVLRDITAEDAGRRAAVLEARTPLTAIRGFAELLTGADIPERIRSEYLQTVLEQCERLAAVLDGIYDGPIR